MKTQSTAQHSARDLNEHWADTPYVSDQEQESTMPECGEKHTHCKYPSSDSLCSRREGHLDADHKCKSCGEWFR